MPNEVKLLPCEEELIEKIAEWHYNSGSSLLTSSTRRKYKRWHEISESDRVLNRKHVRAIFATRPTIVTDEVVELRNVLERVDDFIVNELAGEQPTMDYCQANPEAGEILLAVRTALAAMPAMVGGEGWGEKRVCSVCTAVISQYPEGMCCHCQEMPWPLAQPDTPHD